MAFALTFGALMGTGFLMDRRTATAKGVVQEEKLQALQQEKMQTGAPQPNNQARFSGPGSSFLSPFEGQDLSLPTYTSNNISTAMRPIPQVFEGRDDALFGTTPALPDAESGIKGTHRTLFIRSKQEVANPFEPAIGHSRDNFRAMDIPNKSYYDRLPINTKDFRDASGAIPQSYSTGQIPNERSDKREAYLLDRGMTRDPRFGQVVHQIRKTTPATKTMGIAPQISAYVPGIRFIETSSKRKNAISTWTPARKSCYQQVRMDPDAMINLGTDRTLPGRQPYVKGMCKPTRPAIADLNISMKEDDTLPGRQPGPSAGIVRKPYTGGFGEISQANRVSAEWHPDSGYASYRGRANIPSMQAKQQAPSQRICDAGVWSEKQGMSHNRTQYRGISKANMNNAIGLNTRSGRMEPPYPRSEVLTDYLIERVTKPEARFVNLQNIMRPTFGLHATSNPTVDKKPFVPLVAGV